MKNKQLSTMIFDGMIIVSDIDGTFLGDGRVERNFEAVERFKRYGGRFTFSTGRIQYNVRNAMGEYGNICNAPAICANGACIYDFERDCTLLERCISVPLSAQICEYAQEVSPEVGIRCSTERGFLTNRVFGLVEKDFLRFKGGDASVLPVTEWKEEKIYKIVCRGEHEQLDSLRNKLQERFKDSVCYTSSSPTFLELNAPGCTKAAGVEFLRRMYTKDGRSPRVFAIGDFENDMEMLRYADYAACPENALDKVKSICHKTFCHCNEGAIADLIEYIEENLCQSDSDREGSI